MRAGPLQRFPSNLQKDTVGGRCRDKALSRESILGPPPHSRPDLICTRCSDSSDNQSRRESAGLYTAALSSLPTSIPDYQKGLPDADRFELIAGGSSISAGRRKGQQQLPNGVSDSIARVDRGGCTLDWTVPSGDLLA